MEETMKFLTKLATLVITIVIASSGQASTLFQLKNNPDVELVDEAASLSLTIGGITATLTANTGVLNTTTGGFGVNATPSGDTTDEIDAVNGIESVTITFNVPVSLTQIVLSNFTGSTTGDLASLTIDGFAAVTLNPTVPALDVYNFTSNNTVLVGQSIVLAYLAGNGFSFDSFSVIPEPASGVLLLIGVAAAYLIRRRQPEGRS
jgi:hypothetical protein